MESARKAALPPPLPKPKSRKMANVCSVPQEAFSEPAKALAAKLGWEGEPAAVVYPARRSGESDDAYAVRIRFDAITVRDAQRFLQKSLHEHFAAGALGREQPTASVSGHLEVDTAEEKAAVEAALSAAYESGKGTPTSEVEIKKVSLDANAEGSATAALSRMQSKVGK